MCQPPGLPFQGQPVHYQLQKGSHKCILKGKPQFQSHHHMLVTAGAMEAIDNIDLAEQLTFLKSLFAN